jgi:hypothetical protein
VAAAGGDQLYLSLVGHPHAMVRSRAVTLLARRMGTYDEVATAYLYLTENGFSG